MIIYNSTKSWLIIIGNGLECQVTNLTVNTKESVFPVCNKPYHKNKRKLQKGEEVGVLWDCPF